VVRVEFGTPLMESARRILLLGSGELGKEMAIEAQRLGAEVVAVDRYDMAPAMHVAHRRYVINMMDGKAIKAIVRREVPDAIIAEIEAINTDALMELEEEGFRVVPNARAVKVCMNRIELRRLAAEKLGLPTTKYYVAESPSDVERACKDLGYPCLIKPEMSSSGHGHVIIKSRDGVEEGFRRAIEHARGASRKVIVEEFVEIDREFTVLTYRHRVGSGIETRTLTPIEHQRPRGSSTTWSPGTTDS
jgi:phosphoribosylglycinamide formyltransferase 2 (EC 2.1.2.-) 